MLPRLTKKIGAARSSTKTGLNDPFVFTEIFLTTANFAFSPRASKHSQAVAFGLGDKEGPWTWIRKQVRKCVNYSGWRHPSLIDRISVASSKLFRRIGRRRYPLYLTPKAFVDLFGMWTATCGRRMDFFRWSLALEGSEVYETKSECAAF